MAQGLPKSQANGSRLTKKPVPATWDNVYQIYLRRTHVMCMAETWRELGGSEGFSEIAEGISGAFVRVYTKAPESILAGTYHLQQVEAMIAPTKPNESVKLKLDGHERLVPVEKLSDKWPEESEIVNLKERIDRGRAHVLYEGAMRATVTRLAVMQHCRLLKGGQESAEMDQEQITEVADYLRLLVDDERRSMQSAGRDRDASQQQDSALGDQAAGSVYGSDFTERPRRSQRAPAAGAKRERTDTSQTGSDSEQPASAVPAQPLVPLGDRKPVIANMKARRLVSLNELMMTAQSA